MNVVEAYIKYTKSLIILISGMSGSGKTDMAKYIERDFKIKRINLNDYCKKNYDKTEVIDGKKIVDWDHIDAIDWDKFNKDIDEMGKNGVVVSGFVFPKDKVDFKVNFHLHIKINKKTLLEKRHEYLEKHKDDEKCKELYELKGTPIELAIINKLTYPHYLDYVKESDIHRFLNANESSLDELYDSSFDYMMERMKNELDRLLRK